MSKKKSFMLRISPETYKKIEEWAGDEFRSVNGQLEFIIDKALREAKRNLKKKNDDEE
jgi:hypothetical protein